MTKKLFQGGNFDNNNESVACKTDGHGHVHVTINQQKDPNQPLNIQEILGLTGLQINEHLPTRLTDCLYIFTK